MMNKQQIKLLSTMGITAWQLRNTPASALLPEKTTQCSAFSTLAAQVKQCQQCDLHKTRQQTVFGVGNTFASVLIVGDAPGTEEDQTGEPFVGAVGQLLNQMLQAIGLQRDEVYLTNLLKCRPPEHREAEPADITRCSPFLTEQIALLQPSLIVAFGRTTVQALLNTKTSLDSLRSRLHAYGDKCIPLIATYHPAHLLHAPQDKPKAYQDLLLIKQQLDKQS